MLTLEDKVQAFLTDPRYAEEVIEAYQLHAALGQRLEKRGHYYKCLACNGRLRQSALCSTGYSWKVLLCKSCHVGVSTYNGILVRLYVAHPDKPLERVCLAARAGIQPHFYEVIELRSP